MFVFLVVCWNVGGAASFSFVVVVLVVVVRRGRRSAFSYFLCGNLVVVSFCRGDIDRALFA